MTATLIPPAPAPVRAQPHPLADPPRLHPVPLGWRLTDLISHNGTPLPRTAGDPPGAPEMADRFQRRFTRTPPTPAQVHEWAMLLRRHRRTMPGSCRACPGVGHPCHFHIEARAAITAAAQLCADDATRDKANDILATLYPSGQEPPT